MKEISAEIADVARSYKYPDPPQPLVSVQELVNQFLRLVNDFLNSIHIKIPGMADTRAAGTVMQVLLYVVGFAGALTVIYLVWSRLGALKSQSQKARKQASRISKSLDSAGWRQEAESLASTGEWRGSCRSLYLSLLQLLHERDIAVFAPAKTNYEYWYVLSKYPTLQMRFRHLVAPVEMIWYGNKQAGQADYEQCLAALAELEIEIELVAPSGTAR